MNLDLNLLRIFDTLIELRSVTRAADRLGLTQSAVSHALGRLRQALDDPLFVRGRQGFQPTPRAMEIAPGIREGLRRLNDTLLPSRAEGADPGRRFTLAAGAYFCTLLIPPLMRRVRAEAPGVSIRVVAMGEQLAAAIDRGIVDIALGVFGRVPGRFVAEPLFEDEMVWIAAAGSAQTALPFDADRIAALPRVMIVSQQPFGPPRLIAGEDDLVSGYSSAAALDEATTVYESQTAMALVATTDLVALVPRRIAERAPDMVKVLGPDGAGSVQTAMLWQARQRGDPGLDWLRGVMREIV